MKAKKVNNERRARYYGIPLSFFFAAIKEIFREHKEDAMETSVSYLGGEHAYFSSDERRWCNRIARLAEDHTGEVTIIRTPDQNDGCIYAKIPVSWFRIQPKKRREISDEERLILSERMRKLNSERQ